MKVIKENIFFILMIMFALFMLINEKTDLINVETHKRSVYEMQNFIEEIKR